MFLSLIPYPLSPKKGFTLLELLLVVGILAILALVGFVSWIGFRNTAELDAAADAIVEIVTEARGNAISGQDFTKWGISAVNPSSGTSYTTFFKCINVTCDAANRTQVKKVVLPKSVEFVGPADNSTVDAIFDQRSATVSGKTRQIRICLVSRPNICRAISIYGTGLVEALACDPNVQVTGSPTTYFMSGAETGDLSEFYSPIGAVTADSATTRSGNYSFKADSGVGVVAYASTASSSDETWAVSQTFRVYFRFNSLPSAAVGIFRSYGVTSSGPVSVDPFYGLYLTETGTLFVKGEYPNGLTSDVSTTVLEPNIWYRITTKQFLGGGSDGIEIFVNGVLAVNFSGPDWPSRYLSKRTDIGWLDSPGASKVVHADDIRVITNDIGAAGIGDGAIVSHRTTVSGATPTSGDVLNAGVWQDTTEIPANAVTTATYTGAALRLGTVDMADFTEISSSDKINAVKIGGMMRRGTGGTTTHFLRIKSPTSEWPRLVTLDTSFQNVEYIIGYSDSSSQQAWTKTALDGTQAGMQVQGAQDMIADTLYIQADYSPAPPSQIPGCPALNQAPSTYLRRMGTVDQNSDPNAWYPSAFDPDGDPITCSISTPPPAGHSATVASDCSSGTYTPSPGYTGTVNFSYRASDGDLFSSPDTVSVRVVKYGACPASPMAGNVLFMSGAETGDMSEFNPGTSAFAGGRSGGYQFENGTALLSNPTSSIGLRVAVYWTQSGCSSGAPGFLISNGGTFNWHINFQGCESRMYVPNYATGQLFSNLYSGLWKGWNIIEFRGVVANSGGSFSVAVNGTTKIIQSGLDTDASNGGVVDRVVFSGGESLRLWDDFIVTDNNSYPGDGRVRAKRTTVIGAVPTTGNALDGPGSAWENTSEVPANALATASYLGSPLSGSVAIADFTEADFKSTDRVNAVKVGGVMYRSSGGGTTHVMRIREGGINLDFVRTLSTALVDVNAISLTKPTGGSWTKATLDATEAGFGVTGAQDITADTLYIQADYCRL